MLRRFLLQLCYDHHVTHSCVRKPVQNESRMKGEPHLVARAEQVAEAGLPLDKVSARLRVQEPTMPTYERGDYMKIEFQDETTVIGEWMWVRVHHCDDEKQLVFGTLGNQLVNDYGGKVELGSELAVSYSQIREHKRASDFTSKN